MDSLAKPDYEYLRQIFIDIANERSFGNQLEVSKLNTIDLEKDINKRNHFIKAKSSYHTSKRGSSANSYAESKYRRSQVVNANIQNS